MKFVIFTIFVMIAMAMVVSEEVPAECSPWLGYVSIIKIDEENERN